MAMAVQKLYLNEDKWRIKYIVGTGDIYFQFFAGGDGTIIEEGRWIDYNTSVDFMLLDIKRLLIKNLYVGLEGTLNKSITVYEVEDPIYEENPTSKANLNSLGYNFLYDSRDHVNFPTKGFFIQYKNSYVREAFGATEKFDQFEIAANYFWDIKNNGNSILVSRAFADIASGDVPFEGQNIIGRDDLRGYSEGKYRGNQVYAVQTELRQHLYKKFGMVGFLGIGAAVDEISEIGDTLMLPSIGFGVRYLMIGKEKINIGVDVGFGRDDWSLSFRIGETFGR
jgi:outer membrane protein assembly factor BamA